MVRGRLSSQTTRRPLERPTRGQLIWKGECLPWLTHFTARLYHVWVRSCGGSKLVTPLQKRSDSVLGSARAAGAVPSGGPRCAHTAQAASTDGRPGRPTSIFGGISEEGELEQVLGQTPAAPGESAPTSLLLLNLVHAGVARLAPHSPETESRGGALPSWGRGADTSPCLGQVTAKPCRDFHFSREGDRQGLPLTSRGAAGHCSRQEALSALLDSPLAPLKLKVAAERCRSGAEVRTPPPAWAR